VTQKTKKPWGGRFESATHPLVEQFTESISFDHHLATYDITGSCAHAEMLAHIGLIKKSEAKKIIKGLRSIEKDIIAGSVEFSTELEDIHMNIETELRNRIGPVAGKLHTGRSRNDQVALDERLMLRDILAQTAGHLCALQSALVCLAEENQTLVIPGFTHLQYAMPVLVAHHLLSYVEAFDRDRQRLVDQYKRVNIMPLGSAALAGSGFPLDRSFTAEILGFDGIARNSMDAVADRDYLLEFLSSAAIIGMHLSRLAEDLILWASQPFGFIDIADAFCTGSSLMPNKKNPDVLELVRGKCGRIYGNLVALLTIMKGLPMTYNRDLQEDKEPVFDSSFTVSSCLEIMAELVPSITFRPEALAEASSDDFLYATDWTDYLVQKGVPFRDAHELVGRAVGCASRKNCGISELSLDDLTGISSQFDAGILKIRSAEASVKAKSSFGSTQPAKVKQEIRRWKRMVKKLMT
jgi:argininosuccinate lyase